MNQEDLHCSRGPVSSMPGSSHPFPEGSVCDRHPQRPAVKRIQGETDSMGCEYFLACEKCVRGIQHYFTNTADKECRCEWCSIMKKDVKPYRDYDEGMAGPLYQVCADCRAKDQKRWAEEAEANRDYAGHDDYDDYDPPSRYDAEDDWNNGDGHGAGLHHAPSPVRPPIVTLKRVRRIER